MRNRLLQTGLVVLFTLIMVIAGSAWQFWTNPMLYDTVDKKGVFHIRSEADMEWFLYYLGEGYESLDAVLDADIDMKEVYFYRADNYSGHFDGQGFALLNPDWFIFENVKAAALVENLYLENANMHYKKIGAGGISYTNFGVIRNCQVTGRIEAKNYVGGIVSKNYGLISDCLNYADIISTETGATLEDKYQYAGFGAGGIAGFSGTSSAEDKEYQPDISAIIDCVNYGSVTAQTLVGGICAFMEDQTNGGSPNLSVQELIETTDFEVFDQESSSDVEETKADVNQKPMEIVQDMVSGMHYSMINCKNYGTILVENIVDIYEYYTMAAGICGILYQGDLYHCANLGKVMISEDAPKVSDTGWVFTRKPYAITEAMGLSPSINHVVDCVNLKETMPDTMWPESVMEITEEELELWEKGKLPYISNNWHFQLEEAIRLCALEPIEVEESVFSKERNSFYQCEEFVISLPEGFVIREESVGDIGYALHITVDDQNLTKLPETLQGEGDADFEVWLLRKETNTKKALTEVIEIENKLVGIDNKYFMEEVYSTIPNNWLLKIDAINLPFHKNTAEKNYEGKRIFMESGLSFAQLRDYQQEGNHVLGNYLAMPLEGGTKESLRARWLLVFTNQSNNIHPTRSYIDIIEQGFYPLDGNEEQKIIRKGETLTAIAKQYTGSGNNWRLLADINGIEDPNLIVHGTSILVPNRETYEEKSSWIADWWFAYGNITTE